MSTVAYYRRSTDADMTVTEYPSDMDALEAGRRIAIDTLAAPVIVTYADGRHCYVAGRRADRCTIGHRGISR